MAQPEEQLELVKPDIKYAQAYLAMIDAHFASGEEYNYNNMWLAREDFAAFVRELEDEAQGIGLLAGLPRQQTYFLLKDGVQIIGEIRFRPHLEEPYEKLNGHVGYNIHPAYRGRGYGTRQLALLLEEARKLALSGVSMTIEDENPSSVRVIQKNGGRLLRVVENPPSIRIEEENGELVVKDTTNEGERCALWWIDL